MESWVIDWDAVKAVIEALESIAVLVASIFAAMGFYQWRKEIIEKRKIELAEEVADIFSRMPNVIMNIRSPAIFSSEGHSQVQDGEEPNPGHVAFERLANHEDFFSRVDSVRYRFLAYFGDDKDGPFEEGRKVLGEIRVAAHTLKFNDPEDGIDGKLRRKCETALWWSPKDDDLSQRIEKAKNDMLKVCLPVLRSSVNRNGGGGGS